MINQKRIWNEKDNKTLANIVIDSLKKGLKISDAVKEASEQLGRTEEACKTRWAKFLSKKHKNEVKNAKVLAKASKYATDIESGTAVKPINKNNSKQPSLLSHSVDFNLLQKLLEINDNNNVGNKKAKDVFNATKYLLSHDIEVYRKQDSNDYIVIERNHFTGGYIQSIGTEDVFQSVPGNRDAIQLYIVTTNGKKVVSCDCKDENKSLAYKMKVAIDQNLEIF